MWAKECLSDGMGKILTQQIYIYASPHKHLRVERGNYMVAFGVATADAADKRTRNVHCASGNRMLVRII